MPAIIMMNSKTYLRKFIPTYDYKKFQTLIVSDNIRTKKKYKEAYVLDSLMPSTITLSSIINSNDKKTFKSKYRSQLTSQKNEGLIALLMKMVVIDNIPVVMICTPEEEEYGYMKILKKYVEEIYDVDILSFDEFDEDPDNVVSIYNPKKTKKVLKKHLASLDRDVVLGKGTNKKMISEKLDQMSKKALRAYAKDRGIIFHKEEGKKELKSRIMGYLFK